MIIRDDSLDSHKTFATAELKKLLHTDSFAFGSWKSIGDELHYRLVEWPDEEEVEFSQMHPIDALYIWATKEGGLDPEWITDEDGFIKDSTELEGLTFKVSLSNVENFNPSISPVEQLTAYGLWLLSEHYFSIKAGEDYGFTLAEVNSHRTGCVLLAYQALVYAQNILLGSPPSVEEIEKAKKTFYSEAGKVGADIRHATMRLLREWTIAQYQAGNWASANKASHDLKEKVLAHGRTIGAHLSVENAQRTIAEWIRKSA